MAALISILLEMPKGDAMSSTGFSIRTTWATRICKEKNFISRIQVQPHGTRTTKCYCTNCTTLLFITAVKSTVIWEEHVAHVATLTSENALSDCVC